MNYTQMTTQYLQYRIQINLNYLHCYKNRFFGDYKEYAMEKSGKGLQNCLDEYLEINRELNKRQNNGTN